MYKFCFKVKTKNYALIFECPKSETNLIGSFTNNKFQPMIRPQIPKFNSKSLHELRLNSNKIATISENVFENSTMLNTMHQMSKYRGSTPIADLVAETHSVLKFAKTLYLSIQKFKAVKTIFSEQLFSLA